MQNLLVRVSLVGVFFHAVLLGPVAAQVSIQDTAEVTAFVNEPHFCEMFVAATGREDGVSQDYTKGSETALKSLLRSNVTLSIPQAFAFIQSKCVAKLDPAKSANVKTHTPSQ
jgi:hypothetical protein